MSLEGSLTESTDVSELCRALAFPTWHASLPLLSPARAQIGFIKQSELCRQVESPSPIGQILEGISGLFHYSPVQSVAVRYHNHL